MKINIDNRYPENEEANRAYEPYKAFYDCLKTVFDMSTCKSFCDVGCADGHLLAEVKKNNAGCDVVGLEYFEYHIKYADPIIRDAIKIWDIRDEIDSTLGLKKYEIVVCTEVGEHIEPEFANTMLQNIKALTEGVLVLSWSPHGGENERDKDPHHQHLNPLKFPQVIDLMEKNGFEWWRRPSQALLKNSFQFDDFHYWWRQSLSVWRVKQ